MCGSDEASGPHHAWSDEQLIAHIQRGHADAFAWIMRRYNQRLYRVARAIVRDDEAEDVLQHAYVAAFAHLSQFRGAAKFSTWLTRIVINEALARVREQRRTLALESFDVAFADSSQPLGGSVARDPEEHVSAGELATLLEQALAALPEAYRVILVLRELEGLSTLEAAECLSISEESARVRLHRARAMVRDDLYERVGPANADVFKFGGERCARVTGRVLAWVSSSASPARASAPCRPQDWPLW